MSRPHFPRPGRIVVAALLAPALAGSLAAQRVSLAPTVGVYIPTEELVKGDQRI